MSNYRREQSGGREREHYRKRKRNVTGEDTYPQQYHAAQHETKTRKLNSLGRAGHCRGESFRMEEMYEPEATQAGSFDPKQRGVIDVMAPSSKARNSRSHQRGQGPIAGPSVSTCMLHGNNGSWRKRSSSKNQKQHGGILKKLLVEAAVATAGQINKPLVQRNSV